MIALLSNNTSIQYVGYQYSFITLKFRCSAIIVFFFIPSLTLANEYSEGMKDYVANDYKAAQIHWLNSVKQNNLKAMFNLGLLHQHNKLKNSDVKKAERWFKLAGENGYPAADFHLAKWKLEQAKGSEQTMLEIKSLLQRSASNKFLPAENLLKKMATNAVVDEPLRSSLQKKSVDQSVNVQVNSNNDYHDESWIVKENASAWTIQMLAFKDKKQLYQFVDEHKLHDVVSYFAEETSNGVLYKLIYGSYETKQEASNVRDNMPLKLKTHGPWLRQISSIQALIQAN